jgi:hypothetical protein
MQFTFAGDSFSGAEIFIIEGNRVYTVAGEIMNSESGDPAEIDRFMMSFKLTAEP